MGHRQEYTEHIIRNNQDQNYSDTLREIELQQVALRICSEVVRYSHEDKLRIEIKIREILGCTK